MPEHKKWRFLQKEMSHRIRTVLIVRRATLSALLNGNAALSVEMTLRTEKGFGVSMDTLLRMQAWRAAALIRMRKMVCEERATVRFGGCSRVWTMTTQQ